MRVTPIAQTLIDWDAVVDALPESVFTKEAPTEFWVEDMDALGELAGRACYKAWDRKNPATAETEGYLKNILSQGHYSVLEHSSVTFYVEGVSRALLVELERHRFLSFSVESQRYVDQAESHPHPVIPPAIRDDVPARLALQLTYASDIAVYRNVVNRLTDQGKPIKEAREAARAFLPNATPVDLVVTGNLRCWRDVLGKRYHMAADAEIREFATAILGHLREIAPHSFQDFPNEPFAK
ncbi:FAD-dependent thymidylate synthase [Catellatospora sichuanensis]|uniref:FAD-dependent thymidylate synthase n=1 Tax=Catellatospora sichuanensis TaxID=1969805 RepID=UPI001C92AC3A|nr:FAD-dependent thymidylate synthase [Catellatospora sichuanensis]